MPEKDKDMNVDAIILGNNPSQAAPICNGTAQELINEIKRLRVQLEIATKENDRASETFIYNFSLLQENRKLATDCDRYKSVVQELLEWSTAYPESVFPEPSPELIDAICQQMKCRIDSISAMILRRPAKRFGELARRALIEAPIS